ncbi:hypothetical protein MYCTH_2296089 [Thermothelomyces thermophilus ATCC 42464]|uniref:PNPLA domain-containing protein n=1 Tax=Thermothelomyces thermophilus (strain ATCC 42464 / BCRC 31852 / DSM 1799) TaxID=573729 RepID=G2Q0H0_THET4|nr:uncharacterized protein MYCTH_2296089 [Thermothelomyces thermophilus ATCC 42464]AEO54031.1 hypothetical protein MYCTH_2296089 [Thermothelomyces thermophilus ATCC 42464]
MSSAKDEAINLLSLDGGGVRGVASLVILHEIMLKIKESQRLDHLPKPCEYFHMIGGTSTGGLIAIMLGRLRMSTEEALHEYDQCASKIFSSRNKKWNTATEKFRATALKEVVQDLVRRRNTGEYLRDPTLRYDSKGQCFVCVMPAHQVGEPRRLRSFGDPGTQELANVKIWEAARATTAASVYFKPMTLKVGPRQTEDYIDAAIGCNNPADYVLREAVWQFGSARRLGCLVSIGTGTRVVKIGRAASGLKNIVQTPTFVKELLGTLKNAATDSEETHRQLQAKLGSYPDAYFRFNVPDAAAEVRLDEYLKMGKLKSSTAVYLSDPNVSSRIQAAARVLKDNSSEHGLTLGHTDALDKDQVVLSTLEPQPLGYTTRFFTGREDILAKLRACFYERNTGGKPRREFLLYGMGGVGKTQIALKTADDLEDQFKYIFHVDGKSLLTASQSYASICRQYSLGSGTTEVMKQLALEWLEGLSDEWLIIYDDCPEQDRFRPLLPRRNKGNIIYTSRSQGLQAEIPAQYVCEVPPFEEADAVDLLLKVSGREQSEWDEEELGSAREIVASVGYLPIAIESAGSYIREGGCNAITYLQRFRDSNARSELLSRSNSDASSPARPALYTAFDLSYDAIVGVRRRRGRSVIGMAAEHALQALNLLCFYHNERIPVIMMERAAVERLKWGSLRVCPFYELTDDPFFDATSLLSLNYPDGTWNSLPFDLGVQTLQRFSLAKLSPHRRYVSMHVMVQAWAQDRMEDLVREKQALIARMVLIESMVVSWNRTEAAWMRSLPSHVKACLSHKAASVAHDPYQAILDFKLGWYYAEEKQFSEAIRHLNNALRIWRFEKGVHSEPATTVLDRLANVYQEMGNAADAELAYLEVIDRLRLRYQDHGLDRRRARERRAKAHPRRRAKSEELARMLLRRKFGNNPAKDQEAQTWCDDRAVKEQVGNGEDPTGEPAGMPHAPGPGPEVGATPDVGGTTMEQLIEDVKSVVVQRKPRELTPDDLRFEMASVYTGLARLDFDQGRFSSGAGLVMSAIELLKQSGYPDDVRVWSLEDELIRRFRNGGDLRHWARRSSALRSMPPDQKEDVASHEYSFVWQIGYAWYLVNEDSWDEAYQVFQGVLKLATVHYGAGDRRTLYLLRKMALCQLERGLFEEAEELARTAVERAKASYGQWHLQTAKCLDTLSIILMSQSLDLLPGSEFWTITREAYDSAEAALPPDHYLTVRLKQRLDKVSRTESEWMSKAVASAVVQECGLSRARNLELAEPSEDTGEETDEFFQHIDRMFADGYPETKEEYMRIVNAEYREYNRRKLRAREEERNKKKRNGMKQPAAAARAPAVVSKACPSFSTTGSSKIAGESSKTLGSRAGAGSEQRATGEGKGRADDASPAASEGVF